MPEPSPRPARRRLGHPRAGVSRLAGRVRRRAEEAPSPSTPDESEVVARLGRTSRPSARRVAVDLLRPSRAQLLLAVALCLVALASTWQYRVRSADETYSGMRRDELVALMDQLNTSSDDLRRQINQEEATKRELQSGADSRRLAAEQARKRIQELRILAGIAPAEGPGVTITIHDTAAKITPQLLLDGIEEMRDAGAEVIELNGMRIVAQSWLGHGANGIIVNGRAIEAPYVLRVIGEPHALEEGARFRGGLVSRAQDPKVGARVVITPADRLLITSLHTPTEPRFAKPV